MEVKTCEERVLMELDNAEKEVANLKEEQDKDRQYIQFINTVIQILQQICVLDDVGEKNVVFKGEHVFDKEQDANIINILDLFRKKDAKTKDEDKVEEEKDNSNKK